jgi:predicted hydrolase (HD superfamily)
MADYEMLAFVMSLSPTKFRAIQKAIRVMAAAGIDRDTAMRLVVQAAADHTAAIRHASASQAIASVGHKRMG